MKDSSPSHPKIPQESPAFTLVELLVVITIISVLMGLLFPVIGSMIEAARKTKAKNDVMQITIAVKGYFTEYGKLPTSNMGDDAAEASQGWFQYNNDEVMRVLSGEDYNNLNPRRISFLETRPAKGTAGEYKDGVAPDGIFYDVWGTPYAIKLDISYDGALEYYEQSFQPNVRTSIIAVSFGKNQTQQNPFKTSDDNGKVDDIVSFQ